MTDSPPQHACRLRWESDPQTRDGHAHEWHLVVTAPRGADDPYREAMTVCRVCTAPRCGHTFDDDPCLSVRHHLDPHVYESGAVRPVGA